jgi:hypothetical protein
VSPVQNRELCPTGTSEVGEISIRSEYVNFRIIGTNSMKNAMIFKTKIVKKTLAGLSLLSTLLLSNSNALAAVTVTFSQSGSNVVVTASGSINTTGFNK